MAIIWTGNGFTGLDGFVSSQFFADDSNTPYFYEQNYQAFYAATVSQDGLTATLTGNGSYMPVALQDNTTLYQLTQFQGSVSACETLLLNSKYSEFKAVPDNTINILTQNPGAFLATTITDALSGSNIGEALFSLAPYFVDPQLHFSLNDIAESWPNGVGLLENLCNVFQNLQANTQNPQDAAKRITDFKKKLIRMQTETASQVRQLQSQIQKYQTEGTFTALASAFPSTFGPIVQALDNSNQILGNQLAKYLPTGGVSGFLVDILNQVLGSEIPPIVNPVDKILADINSIENDLNNIVQGIPTDGFGSLTNQTQFLNQIVAVLVNKINTIPIVSQRPAIAGMTDPNQIIQSVSAYANQILGQNVGGAIGQELQKQLTNTMNAAASSVMSVSDSTDPSAGGSLFNLGPLLAVFQGELDQSIKPPNISLSPDPVMGSSAQKRNNSQEQADQASTPFNLPRGSGIHIFDEVWMRPRNTPVDGSDGDYKVIPGIYSQDT